MLSLSAVDPMYTSMNDASTSSIFVLCRIGDPLQNPPISGSPGDQVICACCPFSKIQGRPNNALDKTSSRRFA